MDRHISGLDSESSAWAPAPAGISGIQDSPSKSALHRIVEVASAVCGSPVVLRSFDDNVKEWLAAEQGKVPVEFLGEATHRTNTSIPIQQTTQLAELDHLTQHSYAADDHQLHTSWPLISRDHVVVGSLCVIVDEQVGLDDFQISTMEALAQIAAETIGTRHHRQDLFRLVERHEKDLAQLVEQSETIADRTLTGEHAIPEILELIGDRLGAEDVEYWFVSDSGDEYRLWSRDLFAAGDHTQNYESANEPPDQVITAARSGRTINSVDDHGREVFAAPVRNRSDLSGVIVVYLGPTASVLTTCIRTALSQVGLHVGEKLSQGPERNNDERGPDRDSVTGLANRNVIDRILTREFRGSSGDSLAVSFLDLDRYRLINDSFGHPLGDQLLRTIANRLAQNVPFGDFIARFGGDEFVLISRNIHDRLGAEQATKRLLQVLATPFDVAGQQVRITAAAGIALGSAHKDPQDLLAAAEAAMYQAKKHGAGLKFSNQKSKSRSLRTLDLSAALAKAIDNDDLQLHYQPIVSTNDNRIEYVEALCRWNRPGVGPVSPEVFVSIAEQNGLISKLGNWVRRTALTQLRRWDERDSHLAGVQLAVNVSIGELTPGFGEQLIAQVRDTGLSPHRLVLEITESIVMDSNDGELNEIQNLVDAGFVVAVDDFGTGYSSLERLRQLPAQYLKLAGSLMRDEPSNAAFLSGVRELASSLGQSLIIEGVEKSDQLLLLQQTEVSLAQGYYFFRPAPAAELDVWLGESELAG